MQPDDAPLFAQIDARRAALIGLTQSLIRIPTLNPPGLNYLEICEFLAGYLQNAGFTVQLLRATGAIADSDEYPRWNLLARREGTRPGDCVHFNGHHDVVTVGHGWTTDPFGGEVKDGRIYGRGACDMKGGIATAIIAAEAFIATYPDFGGAIEISATADEESGGYGGVAWLAEQGYFSPDRVQHVIIPEPLNKDRICLGHRGVWWAEIETKGRIAHGSMPFLGDSAIRHMGAVLAEMDAHGGATTLATRRRLAGPGGEPDRRPDGAVVPAARLQPLGLPHGKRLGPGGPVRPDQAGFEAAALGPVRDAAHHRTAARLPPPRP